jgi:hypothetical protein
VIFEAAVGRLVGIVGEWRSWPVAERRDMHASPPQREVRW